MAWFRRKPRITEDMYGKLMTSFGRVVDRDEFVAQPAGALAERACVEFADQAGEVDARTYKGAAVYHLRLLAGAWIMAAEGSVPRKTAEVFEEAIAWKWEPLVKGSKELPHRVGMLARGESERVE
jgi:hypothetical protein